MLILRSGRVDVVGINEAVEYVGIPLDEPDPGVLDYKGEHSYLQGLSF